MIQKIVQSNSRGRFRFPRSVIFLFIIVSIFTLITLINNLLPFIALSIILAFVWRQAGKITFIKDQSFKL